MPSDQQLIKYQSSTNQFVDAGMTAATLLAIPGQIPAAQVQTDWNASSGMGQLLNKPTFGTAAAQNTSAFDSAGSAAAAQAFAIQRGNQTGTQTASTISDFATTVRGTDLTGLSLGTAVAITTSDTILSGLGKVQAQINAAQSGSSSQVMLGNGTFGNANAMARQAISLTTTGTSGTASYNQGTGVLNIPNYAPGTGTVTSVGLSSSTLTVSGSPVTTSGSMTVDLGNVGTAGTYSRVTTDAQGRVTAGAVTTINNNVTRSLSNAAGGTNRFTISATHKARVTYTCNFAFTVTALLGASATIFLEESTDNGANWTTITSNGNSFALGLALAGSLDLTVSGEINANALVRLRPATTGGGSATYVRGQEVTY